jgi:hypothetical protein
MDAELEARMYRIRTQGQFAPVPEPEDVPRNVDLPGLRRTATIIGAVLIVIICVVTVVGLIPLYLVARATSWTE